MQCSVKQSQAQSGCLEVRTPAAREERCFTRAGSCKWGVLREKQAGAVWCTLGSVWAAKTPPTSKAKCCGCSNEASSARLIHVHVLACMTYVKPQAPTVYLGVTHTKQERDAGIEYRDVAGVSRTASRDPAAWRPTDGSGFAAGCFPGRPAAVHQAVAGAGKPAGCGLPDAADIALDAAVSGAGAGALHSMHMECDHCRLPADKPAKGGRKPLLSCCAIAKEVSAMN